MMKSLVAREGIASLSAEAEAYLPNFAESFINLPHFSNGRDVDTLVKRIIREYAMSRDPSDKQDVGITVTHIVEVFNKFSKDRMQSMNSSDNQESISASNLALQPQAMAYGNAPPPPSTAPAIKLAKKPAEVVKAIPQPADDDDDKDDYLQALQTILDGLGLNSKIGVERLSTCRIDSAEFDDLVSRLSVATNMSYDQAKEKLMEWRSAQADVRAKVIEQEEEMELAKQMKRKALLPIWRCAVCGAADMPFIACYVQPFIVRYQEYDVTS
jgi:hypothetical protein